MAITRHFPIPIWIRQYRRAMDALRPTALEGPGRTIGGEAMAEYGSGGERGSGVDAGGQAGRGAAASTRVGRGIRTGSLSARSNRVRDSSVSPTLPSPPETISDLPCPRIWMTIEECQSPQFEEIRSERHREAMETLSNWWLFCWWIEKGLLSSPPSVGFPPLRS